MIYIVSNRNINEDYDDERLFGDDFNQEGSDILRVAKAERSDHWKLHLLAENESFLPLERVFLESEGDDRPTVVFIHGYNQSLVDNLDKCQEIASYGVSVIAFSWPSNPGPQCIFGKIKEYKKARKNARRSLFALERFFDKLVGFVENHGETKMLRSLMAHSMGNFLLQSFIMNPDFENQTAIFKNIILHQADVDNLAHEVWVDRVGQDSQVLVTINESDDILDYSDIINLDRLGNSAFNLDAKYANYYDFTRAYGCDDSHRLWHKPALKNSHVKSFFQQAFWGKGIEGEGMQFNPQKNCYVVR